MKPAFANVDLELVSKVDPAPIADALGRKAELLASFKNRGRFFASFELGAGPLHPTSPDRMIARLCDLFEKLPPAAEHLWKQALSRTFDIGLHSGDQCPFLSLRIAPKTLQRVAALGATIAITLYPVSTEAAP